MIACFWRRKLSFHETGEIIMSKSYLKTCIFSILFSIAINFQKQLLKRNHKKVLILALNIFLKDYCLLYSKVFLNEMI